MMILELSNSLLMLSRKDPDDTSEDASLKWSAKIEDVKKQLNGKVVACLYS